MCQMKAFLSIVGLDNSPVQLLAEDVWKCLEQADHIFGGERHFQLLDKLSMRAGRRLSAQQHGWSRPFGDSLAILQNMQNQSVAVLATGDPFHFGIGSTLTRHFGRDAISAVYPAISSISACCARMRWAQEDVCVVSLHGRDRSALSRHFSPSRKMIVLSADRSTPTLIATMLRNMPWPPVDLHVFSDLGAPGEHHAVLSTGEDLNVSSISDLNVVAFECPSFSAFGALPSPALDDEIFDHDGQLTKSTVRAVTVAQLRPFVGACLWDIGAGSGAVSIAFAAQAGHAKVFAVESRKDRIKNITSNVARAELSDYTIIEGRAPDALVGLPRPDAIFIGGGVSGAGVMDKAWRALLPGGVLVVNAVTLEGESILQAYRNETDASLSRLSVQQAEKVGPYHGWRPLMPVTQLVRHKSRQCT